MLRLAAALVALAAAPALAQQPAPAPTFPTWDVRAHCERQLRAINSESATMMNFCLDQQERARDDLRGAWDGVPAQARRHCVAQQRSLTMQNYHMLGFCIDQEVAALQRLQRR